MRVHSASRTCTWDSGSMAIRKGITRKISGRSSVSMGASGSTSSRLAPLAAVVLVSLSGCASEQGFSSAALPASIRIATYNTSLNDDKGELIAHLRAGDASASRIAAVIQHNHPD